MKSLLIITIIFFVLVTTNYYWERNLGSYAMPIFIGLLIIYIALVIACFFQLYLLIKGQFKNRKRLLTAASMIIALCLITLKSNGIIDFERFESKNMLIAQREGAASCLTTLKLKQNNTFIESTVCFGTVQTKGDFEVRGDTIFFKNVRLGIGQIEYYQFAIIKPPRDRTDQVIGDFVRYKNYTDTVGQSLWITSNELVKHE